MIRSNSETQLASWDLPTSSSTETLKRLGSSGDHLLDSFPEIPKDFRKVEPRALRFGINEDNRQVLLAGKIFSIFNGLLSDVSVAHLTFWGLRRTSRLLNSKI